MGQLIAETMILSRRSGYLNDLSRSNCKDEHRAKPKKCPLGLCATYSLPVRLQQPGERRYFSGFSAYRADTRPNGLMLSLVAVSAWRTGAHVEPSTAKAA